MHAIGQVIVLAFAVGFALAPAAPGVLAQAEAPAEPTAPAAPALPLYDFEDDGQIASWTTAVEGATVGMATGAGNARQGRGALEFAYTPPAEAYLEVRGAVAPTPAAKSLTFAIKTTEKTSLRFGVIEEDGSLYDQFLTVPAGKWTDVTIPITDLQLGEEAQDENGEVDVAQINTVYFADLANLPGELGRILGQKTGPQTMWLDNVGLSTENSPSRSKTIRDEKGTTYLLDGFESDLIRFLPMGDIKLSRVAGAPGNGGQQALRIDYQLAERRWIGVVTGAAHLNLAGLQKVRFLASAGNDTRLHVLLEEKDGSRYDAVIDVAQKDGWKKCELDINDFFMGFASTDENAMLDPNQIRVIIFVIDTFNTLVDANGNGSLALDNIELITTP